MRTMEKGLRCSFLIDSREVPLRYSRGSTAGKPQRNSFRPLFESCEQRLLFATYTVDTTLDTINGSDGVTSLREAIIASNTSVGTTDNIEFDITPAPGATVVTISVQSQLPVITDPVVIDGTTQPGYVAASNPGAPPVVQIEGSDITAPNTDGLVITAGNSTVRGLAINRFTGFGIWLDLKGNNTVEKNFLGASADDNNALPNLVGIEITSDNNDVVGNLISGNVDGVGISGVSAHDNFISGNWIGTDSSGNAPINRSIGVPPPGVGVLVDFDAHDNTITQNIVSGNDVGVVYAEDAGPFNTLSKNTIGLGVDGSRDVGNSREGVVIQSPQNSVFDNVVSGNGGVGIYLVEETATFNTIRQNFVGTTRSLAAAGNDLDGITIFTNAKSNTLVGNIVAFNDRYGVYLVDGADSNIVQANEIAFNTFHNVVIENSNLNLIGGDPDFAEGNNIHGAVTAGYDGVRIDSGRRNQVIGNSIFDNGGPTGRGIDLGADGPNANDALDADTGANDLQNAPVLDTAFISGSDTVVTGSLSSKPNTVYRIEVFTNTSNDGEGKKFLTSFQVVTDSTGNVDLTFAVNAIAGSFITATATDQLNNTSEFSASVQSGVAPTVSKVFVNGSTWNPVFKQFLQDQGLGSAQFGLEIPSGSNQLAPVPFINANEISIQFSGPVNVTAADLMVHGVTISNYAIIGFSYDSTTNTATYRLGQNLPKDKLLLILDDNVNSNPAGIPLDGEPDGTPGGNFTYRINVLPGDVDRNLAVTGAPVVSAPDLVLTRNRVGLGALRPGSDPTIYASRPFTDVNGDGIVNAIDLAAVRNRTGTVLPSGQPSLVASIFSDIRVTGDSLASQLTS